MTGKMTDLSSQPSPVKAESERRILVVEDHDNTRYLLTRILKPLGWLVTPVADGLSALQALEFTRFDAVLADLQIAGPSGIRVLEHARLMDRSARLVLYGGYLPQSAKDRAFAINASCVRKGATESVSLLLTALEDA